MNKATWVLDSHSKVVYSPSMLYWSKDPSAAERQMQAVIFLLTTFGYIDGDFDASEQKYVRERIHKLVKEWVTSTGGNAKSQAELTEKFTKYFHEIFEVTKQQIQDLLTETVALGETPAGFAEAKLKEQCFSLLKNFDQGTQTELLSFIDELTLADGQVHPAEVKFRSEMATLFEADRNQPPPQPTLIQAPAISLEAMIPAAAGENHPFFTRFESHFLRDKKLLEQQLAGDRELLDQVTYRLECQRDMGHGWLEDHQTIDELEGVVPFLDEHVYAIPPRRGHSYEFLVLGDLHGCYSVLKAAIMQSHFLDKINAYTLDPLHNPEPRLIFLGDYIDRGLFNLNGVLRTVLQLYVAAPEYVCILRGNHEYFVDLNGKVAGGVLPADTIETVRPFFPAEMLRHYLRLFDALPNMLIVGGMIFVHGGLPRDHTFKQKYVDLSSLNDPSIRLEMMWGDPSQVDVIPALLQDKSARFSFGKLQFRAFMDRIGCHTMIRGHEKVRGGFARTYHGPEGTLLTLFSAGGADNDDLPRDSSYRKVTPMALTILHGDNGTRMFPWPIDYKAYNNPELNRFYWPVLRNSIIS